jgi:hypothetical protein
MKEIVSLPIIIIIMIIIIIIIIMRFREGTAPHILALGFT